jgi:phage gp36-like protein
MPYTDLNRLKKRFSEKRLIELTDDAGVGAVDTTVVDEIIARASGEVDLILGSVGFKTPVSPVPEWVRAATEAIVVYRLYERRGRIPEAVTAEYRATLERLAAIAKQEIQARQAEDWTVEKDFGPRDRIFREKMQ